MLSTSSPLTSKGLLGKSSSKEVDVRVDMTAMIDVVSLLNIFFLVTSLATTLAEIDLPGARHVVGADLESSVIVSLLAGEAGGRSRVYLGDGAVGNVIPEAQVEERVTAAVQQGIQEGKTTVVIKAEKNVPLRDINRIGIAATTDEQIRVHLAVLEADSPPPDGTRLKSKAKP